MENRLSSQIQKLEWEWISDYYLRTNFELAHIGMGKKSPCGVCVCVCQMFLFFDSRFSISKFERVRQPSGLYVNMGNDRLNAYNSTNVNLDSDGACASGIQRVHSFKESRIQRVYCKYVPVHCHNGRHEVVESSTVFKLMKTVVTQLVKSLPMATFRTHPQLAHKRHREKENMEGEDGY